ncbi:MAG TPA: NUDIX hydrolase [Chloroflexia bacterium]|jgi:8-oxo-dGTP pyrophosphatase MutT (NUDIX family)|nr:NUDIX hydrolase [Chloroflexia bacterium]
MVHQAALDSGLLNTKTIRTIAICLFSRNGGILVAEGVDAIKGETFYRPLGGGIEFGEHGRDTVVREIREELGTEVRPESLSYLGTLENVFIYNGLPGHEIVLVYDGELADGSLYTQGAIDAQEDDGMPFRALWKPLVEFGPGAPLYPHGLKELLAAKPG